LFAAAGVSAAMVAVSTLSAVAAAAAPSAQYGYCKATARRKAETTPPATFYSPVIDVPSGAIAMAVSNRFAGYVAEKEGAVFQSAVGSSWCFLYDKRALAADARSHAVTTDQIGHQELIFLDDFKY
jgi:hypothetical protein